MARKKRSTNRKPKYYISNGAYYTRDNKGSVKVVSDAGTLNKLRSGSLKAIKETFGTPEKTNSYKGYDATNLQKSASFRALNKADQQAVLSVFNAVASNDKKQAERLIKGFETASKINDPYFKQQLRLATDAIKRGYTAIDDEADYSERQAKTRLRDLKEDFERRKDFLTVEEATQLKAIERQYEQDLDTTRNTLASAGFGSSSKRIEQEKLLDEATGDLRASTKRKFAYEIDNSRDNLQRETRDTNREVRRLNELTKANKLNFLRKAEEQVGTANLPRLSGAPSPLGDVYGSLPEQRLKNTLESALGFVF
jgi:hypothetical protein